MLTFTRLTVERRSGDLLVLTLIAEDENVNQQATPIFPGRATSIFPLRVSEAGASMANGATIYHWTGGLEAPSLFPDIAETGIHASLRDGVLTPLGKQPRMLRQPVRMTS